MRVINLVISDINGVVSALFCLDLSGQLQPTPLASFQVASSEAEEDLRLAPCAAFQGAILSGIQAQFQRLGLEQRVEIKVAAIPGPRSPKGLGPGCILLCGNNYLGTHLEVTALDARAEGIVKILRAAAAGLVNRHAVSKDAAQHTTPSRVEGCNPRAISCQSSQEDGDAVRGTDPDGETSLVGPESIPLDSCVGSWKGLVDHGSVHLTQPDGVKPTHVVIACRKPPQEWEGRLDRGKKHGRLSVARGPRALRRPSVPRWPGRGTFRARAGPWSCASTEASRAPATRTTGPGRGASPTRRG